MLVLLLLLLSLLCVASCFVSKYVSENVYHLSRNIFGAKKKKIPGDQTFVWARRAIVQFFRVHLSTAGWIFGRFT